MQASVPPQMRSVKPMIQASRGGLEKYPKASSRDQAQYCASSKNRSTTESLSPSRRTRVSTAMSAIARPRPGTTRDRLVVSDSVAIERICAPHRIPRHVPGHALEDGSRLNERRPGDKDSGLCHKTVMQTRRL